MTCSVDREATFGIPEGLSTMESGLQLKELVMLILDKITLTRGSFQIFE